MLYFNDQSKGIFWGRIAALGIAVAGLHPNLATPANATHDLIIRNGIIVDGSGNKPYRGEVVVDGDRLTFVGRSSSLKGNTEINAHDEVIAPGFINMLSHSERSLLADGRALSDVAQGVTLEVSTRSA